MDCAYTVHNHCITLPASVKNDSWVMMNTFLFSRVGTLRCCTYSIDGPFFFLVSTFRVSQQPFVMQLENLFLLGGFLDYVW